jgi:hypothetical protein
MVLPVGGANGKKDKKKQKKAGENVQVNLIVDPGLFGGGGDGDRDRDRHYDRRSVDGDDRESDAYTVPGGWSSGSSRSPQSGRAHRVTARPQRRSIFVALAQEKQWREARSWLKKIMFVDICGTLVWGALFVYILLGKRCPSGKFEGW